MRKSLLTLALLALVAGAALAQFRFGMMGGGLTGDMLLSNKSVQDELKLTDSQKKEIEAIAQKGRDAMAKMRDLFQEDREKAMEVMRKNQEENAKAYKKLREGLTATQARRFNQIQIQIAAKNGQPEIFEQTALFKDLNLTDKQQATIKDNLTELKKDLKEIQDELRKDPTGFREAMPKMQKLRKDTFEKITRTFSADQKKAWKEMQGSEFELKVDSPFGKGKGKKKKDDF